MVEGVGWSISSGLEASYDLQALLYVCDVVLNSTSQYKVKTMDRRVMSLALHVFATNRGFLLLRFCVDDVDLAAYSRAIPPAADGVNFLTLSSAGCNFGQRPRGHAPGLSASPMCRQVF